MKPYYEHGGITIYHGDCREVLPAIERPQLILTDPPYGVGAKYGPAYDDHRDRYWPWFLPVVDLMRRSADVVAFTHRVKALDQVHGWDWVACWHKPFGAGARVGNSPVLPHWEPIIMFGIHSLGTSGVSLPDVISINPDPRGAPRHQLGRERLQAEADFGHPFPKPVVLMQKLLSVLARGLVCDPFVGSGTTLLAAKALGIRAIGIEVEERYCEMAASRLAQEVLL